MMAVPHLRDPIERAPFRLTLNTDGRRHRMENLLALTTCALGVLALVCGFIVSAHVVAAWAGTIAFLGGLYSQYVSVTTPQRSLNIVGIISGFVGAALGIFHGGYMM